MKSFSQVTSVMSDSLRTHGLCDLMGWSPPGSSVLQMSQQEYWSRLPFPSPGNLPNPGIESASAESPALTGGFFTSIPPGEPSKTSTTVEHRHLQSIGKIGK